MISQRLGVENEGDQGSILLLRGEQSSQEQRAALQDSTRQAWGQAAGWSPHFPAIGQRKAVSYYSHF